MKEEYINAYNSVQIIDALLSQVDSILDLMMCSEDSVDHESIKVACEMCMTMTTEISIEKDKLYQALRDSIGDIHEQGDVNDK